MQRILQGISGDGRGQRRASKTEHSSVARRAIIQFWRTKVTFQTTKGRQKKKQVVETTCESHEKTSIGNFNNSEEVAF